MHATQIWQTTPVTAPRQRLIPTNPRSAACAISTAQDYHPNVWSNSSSGIGSVSTPASCTNRSCPIRAVRFAVWSNSSSWIASNTASRAASRYAIFISSSGQRAGAIAGALVGSPTCSSICRTVAGSGFSPPWRFDSSLPCVSSLMKSAAGTISSSVCTRSEGKLIARTVSKRSGVGKRRKSSTFGLNKDALPSSRAT